MDWQTPLALLCVAAGVGWWLRRLWTRRTPTGTTGCGTSCAGCPQESSRAPSSPAGFVSLDAVLESSDRAESQ